MRIILNVFMYIGITLNALAALYIEVMISINDPWQLLNPLLQLKVAYYWIISPVVWLGTALILLGSLSRFMKDKK